MNADLQAIAAYLTDPNSQMRVGRKLRRTLYLHSPADTWDSDLYVGSVDSEELAAEITALWNRHRRDDQ